MTLRRLHTYPRLLLWLGMGLSAAITVALVVWTRTQRLQTRLDAWQSTRATLEQLNALDAATLRLVKEAGECARLHDIEPEVNEEYAAARETLASILNHLRQRNRLEQKWVDDEDDSASEVTEERELAGLQHEYERFLREIDHALAGLPIADPQIVERNLHLVTEAQYDGKIFPVIRALHEEESAQVERRHAQMQQALTDLSTAVGVGGVLAVIIIALSSLAALRAYRETVLAERAARRLEQAKTRFLANMSHEIRTPMTAILGYAEILQNRLESTEDAEAVDIILHNGRHLLEIINDILDLSKIEAGKLKICPVRCSPCTVVSEVVSLMRVRASAKNLKLVVRYASPIPETITTDPVRLRQILLNLVGNAVKFTSRGEVRIVVRTIDVDTGRPQMVFEVSDTGPGISKEQIARLFQPFQQLEQRTVADETGTGLGLVISRRLAQELGGDIEVESEPGKGSTFRVTIDVGSLDGIRLLDNPKEAERRVAPKRAAKSMRFRGRVLLAEDGPENRRLITYILEKAGVEVTAVEDGRQAVHAAIEALKKEEPFDLILMDMQMPVMDGYEAVRQLRAEGYKHPIAALTAHAMESDRQVCLEAGCDAYATKPIDRENLFALLRQYLTVLEPAAS
ncbi:hypothetical protein JCM19992_34490 [Thermostilla marina]